MAHGLKMNVIAEGVETAAQLEFLRANGCDEMQGYFVSTPLPEDEFARLAAGRIDFLKPAPAVAR